MATPVVPQFRSGSQTTSSTSQTLINETIINSLFGKDDDGDSKNTLFVFKLKLFELDFVKECKKRKLKSDLRKAENIRQAIKVATDIFEQSN